MSGMLKIVAALLLVLVGAEATAQYFQQELKYDIEASYDHKTHIVDGQVTLSYTNNAPLALDTIYMHLWANALASKTTPYADQAIKIGRTDFYFADDHKLGGYESVQVSIDGRAVDLQYLDPSDKEIAYLLLPTALHQGDEVQIQMDYQLTLPYRFDRFGWTAESVNLVHWHPSPAVYDEKGWHTMHYLSMGELYSNVATYKVKLDLPFENYVSSADLDGNSYTDHITDFAIVANDSHVLLEETIGDVTVKYLHDHNPSIVKHGISYLRDALLYFQKAIGPYPHKSLGIAEVGQTGGMEYSAVMTVGAESDKIFHYYLVHELLHQWFYGSLVTDQRTAAWLDEGFTTYYQQRYFTDKLGSDYYSDVLPSIHGKSDGLPFLQKMAMAQAYRSYDQPLCTHIDEVSVLNYGLNSYEVPARWIGHMEGYIGRAAYDQGMQQLYKDWKGKHPTAKHMQQALELSSGKALGWLFEDMPRGDWAVDYSISKAGKHEILVENKGDLSTPYALTQTSEEGEKMVKWYTAHKEPKVITDFDLEAGNIKLGPEKGLIDSHVDNNKIGSKPLKIVPMLGLDDNDYRELYVVPLLNYNTSDGLLAGAVLYNSTIGPKRWKYMIAPQYGFQSKGLVGHAWTSYDHYLQHPDFRKLVFKLGAKSYHDQYIESIADGSRYLKIDPSVSLHFRHRPDSHKYSKITLKNINIAHFGNEVSETNSSTIFQLRYESFNFYELSPSDLSTVIEYQAYDNVFGESHNYLKLNVSYKKSWLYSPSKKVSFRLFGSYFLMNSRRQSSSYNPLLTKGATALIHQGFNDYSYEEYWFNRGNQQQGIWGQQVSNYGGGFKTALGSQYNIGQTNDLALALNFEVDLPINLPKYLPLGIYVDVGYYTGKNTEMEDLTGNTLLSSGLALNYGEGLFSIYIPFYNNSPISDIHSADGTNLLGKITFRMDLNRYNPWEIVEDYNF